MTHWRTGEYPRFAHAIREAERRHGIPRDLLARILSYDAETIKGTDRYGLGAIGIAQLTPDVCERYAFHADLRRNPAASIELAGRYLVDLRELFGSWQRAVLAFRWHPKFVRKLLRHEAGEVVPCIPPMIAEDLERIRADVGLA